MIDAYPLQWPDGWERHESHEYSRFGVHTLSRAREAVEHEVLRLGGEDVIISSNLRVRADGGFVGKQRKPDNPGVAVYFTRDGIQEVIANDSYDRLEDNLWGIAKTIEAMRGIERWGCSDLLRRAFKYTAIPERTGADSCWAVLGLTSTATPNEIGAAFRDRMKLVHPDTGGTDGEAARVTRARDEALASTT